jgi:hypothetical protein
MTQPHDRGSVRLVAGYVTDVPEQPQAEPVVTVTAGGLA